MTEILIEDFIKDLSNNEKKLYRLLFEIKKIKDKERLILYKLKEKENKKGELKNQYLNTLKFQAIDKIKKYDYIMENLIEIVDNLTEK